MKSTRYEVLFSELTERFDELDTLFHEHGIEFLGCEDCRDSYGYELNRLLELMREAHAILDKRNN